MQALNIIKIGGSIANSDSRLATFLKNFAGIDTPKIIVHGGGTAATDLCEKLRIPVRMKEGRRITDEPALDVAVMVYAGLINKRIVAKLQELSCNALGLSGADLNMIPAQKRQHPKVDYGFVGDVEPKDINTYFIRRLLDEQVVPVFPAITHDGNGQLLNTNADTIASALTIALTKNYSTHLTYCFEKPGVLQDVEDDDSWIQQIDQEKYDRLKKEGIINEGMIPKLETAFEALKQGVDRVHIKHADNLLNDKGTELAL